MWGQPFPGVAYHLFCKLERPLWRENSEKQQQEDQLNLQRESNTPVLSTPCQRKLPASNLKTSGCSCEPRRGSFLHFYLNISTSTPQDLQRQQGLGGITFLSCLFILFSMCCLHLVILGPSVICMIRASPHYLDPVPSYPHHSSMNIFSLYVFGWWLFCIQITQIIHFEVPFRLWLESIWTSIWRYLSLSSVDYCGYGGALAAWNIFFGLAGWGIYVHRYLWAWNKNAGIKLLPKFSNNGCLMSFCHNSESG